MTLWGLVVWGHPAFVSELRDLVDGHVEALAQQQSEHFKGEVILEHVAKVPDIRPSDLLAHHRPDFLLLLPPTGS